MWELELETLLCSYGWEASVILKKAVVLACCCTCIITINNRYMTFKQRLFMCKVLHKQFQTPPENLC